MANIFIKDRNCVCLGITDYLKNKGHNVVYNNQYGNFYEADLLITWSDIPPTEKKQIEMAKELGIKTIVIQHGRNATVDYDKDYKDLNSGNTQSKFIGDMFLVWGDDDRQRLLNAGLEESKIRVVGCPLIPVAIPKLEGKKYVVFLSHHDLRSDTEAYNQQIHELLLEKYQKDYILIYSPQYLNEKLTDPKRLPEKLRKHSYGMVKADSESRRAWVDTMSIFRQSKAVVSMFASSFEGLACCFDGLPIIRAKCDIGVRKGDEIEYEAKGTTLCDIDNLCKTIDKVDEKDLRAARKEIAEREMGKGLLPAINNIAKVVEKCL